jgi:hypothetical protein
VTAAIALAVWGPSALRPALHAGSYVSIGSPWRAVRSALRLATGEAAAETVVKTAAVVLGVLLLALLIRALRRPTPPAGSGLPALPPVRAAGPAFAGRAAALAPVLVLAVAVAWLFAWPYVLPWYDALGWALLAVVPWSRLDYLLLARTAALAAGYLPARGIALPAGLGWLETVVRTALTPLALLAVLLVLLVLVWPRRTVLPGAAPDGDRPGRARGRAPRLTS